MLGFSLLHPARAQVPRSPFRAGERLKYEVLWRGLPAGFAEIVLRSDRSAAGRWSATATAKSEGYVSNIYPVDDLYQSQFHNPELCSSGIRKQIREGDRRHDVMLQFDPRRLVGRLEDRDLAGSAPPKVEQFPIPACVQDILSALYYARHTPMTVGKSFEFSLIDGNKPIQIQVDVQAEEDLSTAAGKFRTVKVEPDVFSGNLFVRSGRMFLWFTTDDRRLPVQLRAQISVGTITATLVEVGEAE